MRISDWSSDVCSSDLLQCLLQFCGVQQLTRKRTHNRVGSFTGEQSALECLAMNDRGIKSTPCPIIRGKRALVNHGRSNRIHISVHQEIKTLPNHLLEVARDILGESLDFTSLFDCLLDSIIPHCTDRSEEHTSELQSLMRISYAVF